jgi:hypothetical protein
MPREFQIVVLESANTTNSHSLAGPWGTRITSSVPSGVLQSNPTTLRAIQVLPRPNSSEVDPTTIKIKRVTHRC